MRCILHIGTEKTGTTTLQRWLYANRETLAEQGYFLSEVAGVPNNRDLCAFFQSGFDDYFRGLGIGTAEEKATHFAGFRERFVEEIRVAAEDHHTLILTSEHFSSRLKTGADISALHALLRELCDEVYLVCYVREQSELIRSLYSTALLSGATLLPLGEFYEVPSVDEPFFNYTLMLAPWRAVFGADQVHVRVYEKPVLAEGDIRRDFASEFLGDVIWDGLEHEEAAANQSMSLLQSVLIRLINTYLPRFRGPEGINEERSALVYRVLNNAHLNAGRMLKRDAGEVYAAFDPCNRELSKIYLGSSGNPFSAPARQEDAATRENGFGPATAEHLLQALLELFEGMNNAESLAEVASFSTASIRLEPSVVDFLRDVAFKFETGEPLGRSEATRLMRWAQRGRPDGFHINRFLDDHSDS